jgi:hypothetical protein
MPTDEDLISVFTSVTGQKPPEPDDAELENAFKKAEESYNKIRAPKIQTDELIEADLLPKLQEAKEATNILEALESGWDVSVTGLGIQGLPDVTLPQNPSMAYKLLHQLGVVAGDFVPGAVGAVLGIGAGAVAGTGAGIAFGGLPGAAGGFAAGVALGGAGGAFGLPAAMRETLLQAYEKGEVQSFSDFWERVSAVAIEGTKGFVTGAATGAAGKIAGIGFAASKPLVKTSAQITSEVLAMTTVGSALEGHVPEPSDFLEAAILVGGLRGSTFAGGEFASRASKGFTRQRVESRLKRIYAETGVSPSQVALDSLNDPFLQYELLAKGNDVPTKYRQEFGLDLPDRTTIKPEKNSFQSLFNEQAGEINIEPIKLSKKEAKASKLSRAAEAVLENVVQGRKKSFNLTVDELIRDTIDDLHYLKLFDETAHGKKIKDISAEKSAYKKAILSRGSAGEASAWLYQGQINGKTGAQLPGKKPLVKILEPIQQDMDNFVAYAISKRAIEVSKMEPRTPAYKQSKRTVEKLEQRFSDLVKQADELSNSMQASRAKGEKLSAKQKKAATELLKEKTTIETQLSVAKERVETLRKKGIETGVNLEEASRVVKEGKRFEKVFEEYVDFQNNVLKYLKDKQVLSEESFNQIVEAHKDYVPLHRFIEEGTKGIGKGLNVFNPIRSLKGSKKDIINPIESQLRNLYMYTALGHRNSVLLQMVKNAKLNPEAGLMTPVKPKMMPIKVEEGFEIFRPVKGALKDNQVIVYEKGKPKIYEVDKEIAKAVHAMDVPTANMLTKMLAVPARTLRAGTVLSPDFLIRNLIRDQVTAFSFSENGYIPFVTAAEGMYHLIRGKKGFDKVYFDWLKSGGAISSMASLDRQYIKTDVFRLAKETRFMDGVVNKVTSPIQMLSIAAEFMENSTRLGEFKRAKAKGKTSQQAAFEARNITLDFQRIGAKTRALNQISAFFNAHVGGLARTTEAIKADPKGVGARMFMSITIPSILLWWANKDDQRVKDLPNWQKDLFWIIATEDHIYRIPKPFEQGIIMGSGVERMLDAFFTDNPRAFKNFESTIKDMLVPQVTPTALIPFIEHHFNKSLFTKAPIIPAKQEKLFAYMQEMEYTSQTAKKIGGIIDQIVPRRGILSQTASPISIEHFIRAWTGSAGKYALELADEALIRSGVVDDPVKPTRTLADIPFVKAFVVRYPTRSTQVMTDFYDNYEENAQVLASIKELAQRGNVDQFETEALLYENQQRMLKLDGIKNAISNQSALIQMINRDKEDYTPEEKRALIDDIYLSLTEMARVGNTIAEEMKKALKSEEGKEK